MLLRSAIVEDLLVEVVLNVCPGIGKLISHINGKYNNGGFGVKITERYTASFIMALIK
jgi:hypothetical protein